MLENFSESYKFFRNFSENPRETEGSVLMKFKNSYRKFLEKLEELKRNLYEKFWKYLIKFLNNFEKYLV